MQTPGGVHLPRPKGHVAPLRQFVKRELNTDADVVGRILGLASVSPSVGHVIQDLMPSGSGLEVAEREVAPSEEGKHPRELSELVMRRRRATVSFPGHRAPRSR